MAKFHTDVAPGKFKILIPMLSVLLVSMSLFPGSALAAGSAVAGFTQSCYTPGAGLGVTISVTPDSSTQVYAVQDAPPSGWTVSNVTSGGSFDSVNNLVKWGPFFDNSIRTLSYTVTPPAGASGSASFSGAASFDGSSVSISGARSISKCCSYSISPTSRSHGSGADTGLISVTGSSDCTWTATSNASWISILSGASGSGNGTVTYSIGENTGSSRSGSITVAGQTFTVTQSGVFSISPQSRYHSAGAGTGSVSVTAPPGTDWVATSSDAWSTITSGSSGTGNGTVNYSVSANPNTFERTGTLTIVGQTFTVTQAGAAKTSQAAFTAVFPQIAIGGPYTTYLTFAEPNGTPNKEIQIELFDDAGSDFKASFDGNPAASSYTFTLSPFQERVIELSDPGSLRTGWARVTSWPGKVDVSLRFAYYQDPQNRDLETDVVGVGPSDKTSYWTVTLDQQTATDSVGIAIVNPNEAPIDVQFELWSNNTRVPDTQTVIRHIAAHGHLALFVDDIFGTRFNGVGTLTIYASGSEMHVLTLRLDGPQTSTLPANKLSEIWNWSAGGNGGKFYIDLVDSGSFIGLETTTLGFQDEAIIRGYLSGPSFVAERLYQNSETDKGIVVYIGTQTGDGTDATISGTRLTIRDNGTVASTSAFTAQRTN
jgi:hypothetical protein